MSLCTPAYRAGVRNDACYSRGVMTAVPEWPTWPGHWPEQTSAHNYHVECSHSVFLPVVTFYHRIISLKPNFSGRVAPNEVDCAVHATRSCARHAPCNCPTLQGGRTSQSCEREHTNCCTMDFIQIPNAGGASSLCISALISVCGRC